LNTIISRVISSKNFYSKRFLITKTKNSVSKELHVQHYFIGDLHMAEASKESRDLSAKENFTLDLFLVVVPLNIQLHRSDFQKAKN